jgi:hypothetical protein
MVDKIKKISGTRYIVFTLIPSPVLKTIIITLILSLKKKVPRGI